ncbi:MAG: hypothetical protein WBZ24_06680 [Anaerolineales bacterium]|jgi:hypothetical protein
MTESDVNTSTLAETANFMAWKAEEPDGESTYHIELGQVTLHFFEEEWTEFLDLVRAVS